MPQKASQKPAVQQLPLTLSGGVTSCLFSQTYSMSVYLVRQLTSPLLLQRLRMKGIRNPDHSRALSKK